MAISKKKKPNVMLINPPVTSPAMPSLNSAMVAGCLSDSNISVLQYDANLDFFLNYVLSMSCIEKYMQMIETKRLENIIDKADFDILEQLYKRVENNDFSLDALRGKSFFKPEKLMKVKAQIDDLLLLISYAFFPVRIRWDSYCDRKNNSSESSVFDALCNKEFSDKLTDFSPDVVLFFITSQSQVTAAKTMAAYLKSNFLKTNAVAISPLDLSLNSNSGFDHVFSIDNFDPLSHWMEDFLQIRIDHTNITPDFVGLLLNNYLVPELVLSIPSLFLYRQASLPDLGTKGFMFDDGRLMVQWDSSLKESKLFTRQLWDVSKQGIWNHINIAYDTDLDDTDKALINDLLVFIVSNPNIAHSYSLSDHRDSYNKPGIKKIDQSLQSYSITAPIPGKPLWQILVDPAYILLYLKKFGKKKMFCMRYDSDKNSVFSLGENITFHFKKPDDLPEGFLDEICKMVEAGGSVDIKFVRSNLEKAYLIAYAMENGVIVGNSSLKHPRDEFIKRINKITGLDFNNFVERGYTSVRPEYRALGVGAKLLEGLTARVENYKIFSIISEDNKATQKIALRNKTRKIVTYFSEKVGKQMGLWMPEHMIDKDRDIK
jgi:GNAT superfamily N-acetyltransferase